MGDIIAGENMAVNSASGTGIFWFNIFKKHFAPMQVGGNQKGGVMRGLGNTDWGGFFIANGHTPVVLPNDSFSFEAAPEQSGSTAVTGTARCLAVEIIADNRNPEQPVAIYHRVIFGANGTDLSPGQTAPTDTSTPVLYSPKGLCAYYASSQTRTTFQRLRLVARNPAATVDCTTDGVFARTTGEVDAEFEWIVNTNDSSDFPLASDGQQVARMYVTATTYWQLTWMVIEDAPDPWEANRREGDKPVNARFLARFSGHSGTQEGSILLPATTEWWPTDGR